MRLRIYIDTSVIGGLLDPEFKSWSARLWTDFKASLKTAVISDITLRELEEAPEEVRRVFDQLPTDCREMVTLDDAAKELAKQYIEEGVITSKYLADAQHIALATVKRVDVLVSWNFRHIVNLNRIQHYNTVNLKYDHHPLEIRSPREVLDEDQDL